jgi:phosphatidylglycerol lysyltransferase
MAQKSNKVKWSINNRSLWVWLITLITLGSGIITIISNIGPSLPERRAILQEIFPLEFLHVSRFITLLIGFGLIISSINIYRQKRRAFHVVIGLAIASIIFHLTKGLDYEEASFSLLLIIVLFLNRQYFTVKSSAPDLRWSLFRFGAAVIIAFGYGVAGFWFLDRRHFGINFNIGASIHQTLLILSLISNPGIVPRTRYAHWFLNSMYLMTITAIGYSIYAFFRPVIYRFRSSTHDLMIASELIDKYGRSSQEYFKAWPDKSFFFSDTKQCLIAYRVGGNFAVALGDPVGPDLEIEETIMAFSRFCHDNAWGMGFHQVLPDYLPIYRKLGFKKIKIGDEAIVDLTTFGLQGHQMKEIRHSVNQIEKLGIKAAYYDPPVSDEILSRIKEVSDEWLRIPGRRERAFTLGIFDKDYIRTTPIFAAEDSQGEILAFVNLIPSYHKAEATHDLMRRRTETPNGIMDFLFVKLFFLEREKGFERFNLGMAPMSGFSEKEQANAEERAIHYFFQHLNFLFSYSGLKNYKAKFARCWEPRYAIYRNVIDLARFARALNLITEIKD